MKKYLECTGDKKKRFWKIELDGMQYKVQYGQLGSIGRTIEKTFDTEAKASKAAQKQLKDKIKKGYEEADEDNYTQALAKISADKHRFRGEPAEELRSFQETRFLHKGNVEQLCFSKQNDTIFSLSGGALCVWDTNTGEQRHQGQDRCRYSSWMQLAEDENSLLLVERYGSSAKVYDETGKEREAFQGDFPGYRGASAFYLSSEKVLMMGSFQIKGWERGTQNQTIDVTCSNWGEEDHVDCARFSPDGKLLAYGKSSQERVLVVEADSGHTVYELETTIYAEGLAFSPDSQWLATYKRGQAGVQLWNMKTGEPEDLLPMDADWHAYPRRLFFSPEGRFLLFQLSGPSEVCWDVVEKKMLWRRSENDSGEHASFSPDGTYFVMSSHQTFRFLDSRTGKELGAKPRPCKPFTQLVCSRSGERVVGLTQDASPSWVFDAQSLEHQGFFEGRRIHETWGEDSVVLDKGHCLATMELSTGRETVVLPFRPICVGAGKHRIATSHKDGYDAKYLRLWSRTGRHLGTLMSDKKNCPDGHFGFTPDGNWLMGSRGKRMLFFYLPDRAYRGQVTVHKNSVECIAMSPNSRWAASFDKKNLFFWDVAKNEATHHNKLQTTILSLSFSQDSQFVLVATDRALQKWNVETGTWEAGVAFPCYATAATLALDGTAYIAGSDCSIRALDASSLLGAETNIHPDASSFLDFEALANADTDTWVKALNEADWSAFSPLEDTVPLRRFLQTLEKSDGVSSLHYDVTDKLLHNQKRLLHQFGHKTKPIENDTSPCGRWLATGSWVGEHYDEGGELQLWERETGHCVNILRPIRGGIGWPDYPWCMQWSPDGTQLGLGYNTNGVGNFLPFSDSTLPVTSLYVTDGWNRPPGWEWTDDGRAIIVHVGERSCIAMLDRDSRNDNEVVWFASETPPSEALAAFSKTPSFESGGSFEVADFDPNEFFNLPEGTNVPSLKESPLCVKGRNLGSSFDVNPAFPVFHEGEWYWALAFENGLVMCEEAIREKVLSQLSFTIENRFAWPFHWADGRHSAVVEDLRQVSEHALLPLPEVEAEMLKKHLALTAGGETATASMDEVTAQFPCGANLELYSHPNNIRGELNIPLPFTTNDELVLKWEKIENFPITDSFAWEWGIRLKQTKNDCHYLGRFYLNDKPFTRVPYRSDNDKGSEEFSFCRFDELGTDGDSGEQWFDGDHGFNTTLLMRYVPKAGQFKSSTPIQEIISIRFGWKGSYRLAWCQNENKWSLCVEDEKLMSDDAVRAGHTEEFVFDFSEKTMSWKHHYHPTDLE